VRHNQAHGQRPGGRTHGGQKTPGHEQWQVARGAAELYQAHLVPAVTAGSAVPGRRR